MVVKERAVNLEEQMETVELMLLAVEVEQEELVDS